MAQITYQDKVALNTLTDVNNVNKITADDMNEIKRVVNELGADTGWQNITYEHTYSSYDASGFNPLQYRKIGNQVFVRGMIKSTTTNPVGANASAGTLPATAKPAKGVYFIVNNADVPISTNINASGEIRVFNTLASWIALDGINFFID